ncbi:hypothetical protein FS749_000241 [Ceratobasidium sp. UAMH 11750]|nr:hypothetical protein FS749_000241 [Ceratobasidium sp. UAMH 11750]
MIFNHLSASIHTTEGEKLLEYETKEIDDNTIECWIPSTEGENFEIWFSPLADGRPDLALRCLPDLDGVPFQGRILRPSIIDSSPGKCKGLVTSESSIRLFSFGKRILTDKEEIAPSTQGSQKDLNVIRVELQPGVAGASYPQTNFTAPKENGPIHEKVAKKGHAGSAGLGNTSNLGYSPTSAHFTPMTSIAPSVFLFRYAPEDWLQARGIIPSKTSSSQKRDREASSDVIDIDDLETDDDDVVVVKHLVPASGESSNKRRKLKSEDDAKTKLES